MRKIVRRKATSTPSTTSTTSIQTPPSRDSSAAITDIRNSPTPITDNRPLSSHGPLVAITTSLHHSLPTSIEDAALGHFFTFYAPVGALSYLKFLSSHFASSSPPRAAILAPALAIFAQELNQPSLQRFAVAQYSTALADTNLALSTPKRATADGTLGSIILLGLFEALTFDGTKSPSSWTSHIDGALQLVTMRGDDQFKTELGRSLFIDVADCARISYHKRLQPVPPKLMRLERILRKAARLDGEMSQVSDGIAAMIAGLTQKSHDPFQSLRVVAQGRQLQTQILNFAEDLYGMRPYTLIPYDETPLGAYNGIAHEYESAHSARHWNGLRLMGLFVNKWIHRAAGQAIQTQLGGTKVCDIAEMATIMDEASAQVVKLAEGVLGSVPYFVAQSGARCSTVAFARWLIWPLTVVASSKLVSEPAQEYARRQLAYFGRVVGLELGAEGTETVDTSGRPDDYLHLFIHS